MAISLFSLKKSSSSKVTSFVDPTKFGGVASGAKNKAMRSEIAQKTIQAKELKELSYIRRSLELLVSIEKKHYELVTDSIKKFVLSEEKKQLKEEESFQESKKDKDIKKGIDKNPLAKEGKRRLDGFGNFLQGLIKAFVGYKILEWVGNPQNVKKIQDFVDLFANIIKFVNAIVGFGVDKLFSGLSKLLNGEGVTRVFGFLEAAVGFFTLKWLINPTKIISDIKMIGNLFTNVIPNAINSVINFFTNLIPKAAADSASAAVGEAAKQAPKQATTAAKGGTTAAKGATAAAKGGATAAKGAAAAAKGGAKVTGKSILKALPVIGAVSSGIFAVDRASKGDWAGAGLEVASGLASLIPGWGTAASLGIDAALIGRDIAKEQGIPMLAKGGIVTKPTQAIVGEAGPEAILPLDKLGSFGAAEFSSQVDKQIPKFIKFLTLPFKIVGAGIVALITSSASIIPGLGPILTPLISSVASMFGIPPSLVKGMSNFASTAIKSVGQGLSNISEIFGGDEPKITKSDQFQPSGNTTVRGLLGDILSALINKNGSNTTDNPPPSTNPSPTQSNLDPNTGAPTQPTGTPMSNADFAKTQLQSINPKFGTQKQSNILMDVGNKNLQKVTGENPGKYFYDAYGNVYAVDKDEKRILTPADFKAGVGGTAGALYFFRNLNNGKVSISRHADAQGEGWYDYAANAVRELKKGDGSRNNPDRVTWIPAAESKKFKSGFSEATPYGKTTLKAKSGTYIPGNTNIDGDRVPVLAEPGEYVLNKNLVAAAGGPKVLDKLNFQTFPRFANWGGSILKMATGGSIIEYITGDKSHPAYAADHGGGNYHDHLAFRSKSERDKAIKHLESKGWFIGSKNDGRHASGSYHYSDQAFDIPFYPNQSRKRVSDDQRGETKLSSMLRADLESAGFVVPGGRGPGGERENDRQKAPDSKEESTPQWGVVAEQLGKLFKELNSPTDHSTTDVASSAPAAQKLPPISGSIPKSSQSLQNAQRENNRLEAQRRSEAKAKASVVPINIPGQSVTETSNKVMTQALGGTTPPTALTVYPIAP